ncbi:T9SS type A sorting domain-containing protein [Chryseobacterium sp. R2A-55]|uniref:T9SS type A sorting domain-containing protein n=1 Tax=Chryseobacterium sp. R2A-55 TaxID=2744445 RepID=UPI001F3428C0|nr:T9SS type A sorting domain-containing protein [Chryseobacterium sp. R2A-55]
MKTILLFISFLIGINCFAAVPAYTIAKFTSSGSGNWENPASWMVSYDAGVPQVSTEIPGASGHTGVSVEIQCGHTVEIKSALNKGTKYFTIENLTVQGVLSLTNQGNLPTTEFRSAGNFLLLIDGGALFIADKLTLKLPTNTIISITESAGGSSCRGSYNLGFNGNCQGNGNTTLLIGDIVYKCRDFPVINANGGTAIGALAGAVPSIVCYYDSETIPEIVVSYMNYTGGFANVKYNLQLTSKPPLSTVALSTGDVKFSSLQRTISLNQILDKPGDYVFTLKVTLINDPTKTNTGYVTIKKGDESIFSAGSWDVNKGVPSLFNGLSAVINDNYNTGVFGSIDACACTVTSGKTLTVAPGTYVKLLGRIDNSHGGTVVVKDSANLIQVYDKVLNIGNIKVEKGFIFSAGRQQYNLVSSPVIGGNLKSIYPGNPIAAYFNEATDFFYNSTGVNIQGRGLALKEPSASAVPAGTVAASFVGVPFNGTLNFPISYSNAQRGYNLIGNPYPSNIDLLAFYKTNVDLISSTFSFWDNRGNTLFEQQGSQYNGEHYALFNASNGTSTAAHTPGYPSRPPSRFVRPAQGFMIKALSTGTVIFRNESMRVDNPATPQYFGKGGKIVNGAMDRYWLGLTTPSGVQYSAAVVYYQGGSLQVGQDDSKAVDSSENVYTMAGAEKIAIHGRPLFDSKDVLPLGYSASAAGNYTLSLQDSEGVFANGQNIYLIDKQTGIQTDLSQGSYAFSSRPGEFTNRFELVYVPKIILATHAVQQSDVMVYREGNDFVVQTPAQKMTELQVYDGVGRMVFRILPNSIKATIDASSLTNGVYFLKIVQEGGAMTMRKVLK